MRKERQKPLPEGVPERALLVLKRAFADETMGVGDSDFWQPIEERAQMTTKQACFQYYLRGIDHVTLAEICLNSFPPFRAAMGMGDISKEEKNNLLSKVSHFFLQEYPPKYRAKVLKNETS